MSKLSEYREFLGVVRSSIGYWKSFSILQFTTSLTRIMRREKVSGRELASRLAISPTQVSKVLRGNENFTIETMAKFAAVLDAAVHVHVAKKGVLVRWVEEAPDRPTIISMTVLRADDPEPSGNRERMKARAFSQLSAKTPEMMLTGRFGEAHGR